MGAPAKFLFDLDFSAPDRVRERPVTPTEIANQVAQAEARAYRAGFEAAQNELRVDNAHRVTQALEQIGAAATTIASGMLAIEGRMETEAVDVAVAVARKLCSELVASEPLGEVAALVADCFRHLIAVPHLVIRINDQLYEQARDRFDDLAKQSGFQGRLIILAEPDIETGDCRIEWADGGIVRERAAIDAKISELVDGYVAVRNKPATRIQS